MVFDGIAFPESQPSSSIKEFGKRVGSLLGLYKESDLEKPIPGHEQAQEQSFHCFLQIPETILTCIDLTTINQLDLSKFMEDIFCVYEQLREQRTCRDKQTYYYPRRAYQLAEVN